MKRETRSVWIVVGLLATYAVLRLLLADHEREAIEKIVDVDRLRRMGL